MADEINVQSRLIIRKNNVYYQSQPGTFIADFNGSKGPTPGSMAVSEDGTDIDLSELGTPGLCFMMNQGNTYPVVVGRWDPVTLFFYPFCKLFPGEGFVLRLAEDVEEEYTGTGTGTEATQSKLRAKGWGGPGVLLVEAFED